MHIQIEPHKLLRANERGASKEEIIETINNGKILTAKLNRNENLKSSILSSLEMENFMSKKDWKFFI